MKRLFWEDAYMKEFDAKVVDQKEKDGKVHVLLDQTAFYPESGGQPSDIGMIDDIPVEYVYEEGTDVWHVMPEKLPDHQTVHGKIDWDNRFYWMQQHLGQHILSAVCVEHFNSNTVNLRFLEDENFIDIDRPLNQQELEKAEVLTNAYIQKNIAVETGFPPMDEVKRLSKRKLPDTDDAIRIVKIGDLDYIPCCGTHPAETGEVGLVKILSSETIKGNLRIRFICGMAAVKRMMSLWNNHVKLDRMLNIQEGTELERVKKLQDDLAQERKRSDAFADRIIEHEAKGLLQSAEPFSEGKKVICTVLKNYDKKMVNKLFSTLQKNKDLLILLGADTPDGSVLVYGCKKGDKSLNVRDAFKKSIEAVEGRGGGSPFYCQGVGKRSSELAEILQQAKTELTEN